jgi:hypothetical protein
MKIIFMLKTGVIEWEVPEKDLPVFHFGQMATQVRMAGYFMADNLYIRHSELIGISVSGEAGPVVKPLGTILQ